MRRNLAWRTGSAYARGMFRCVLIAAIFSATCASTLVVQAQREPPPAPPASAPAPNPAASAAPAATPEPSPAAQEAPVDAAEPPLPSEAEPSVGQAVPPAPPPPAPPPAPPPQRFEGQVDAGGTSPGYEEDFAKDDKLAAEQKPKSSSFPAFSIRLDPFNWLIQGRLGLELEAVAWNFISVEVVPVFVANSKPPAFNFSGRDDNVSQHSHGIGPIAGASIGAGFWLSGKPLEGYVLRAIFTNYAFTYTAADGGGVFDRVHHTERHLIAFIGSHSRIGFFTLSGGLGLGFELNQQQRCFVNRGSSNVAFATSGCPDSGELQIMLDRTGQQIADLNGGFHPLYIVGRFSLGVAFD
jgi:hypothetical protein